jgi:hypothetical protein
MVQFSSDNPLSTELQSAFSRLLKYHNHTEFVTGIMTQISEKGYITRQDLNAIQNHFPDVTLLKYKNELLDLVIDYIILALNDHLLTDEEIENVLYLKRLFEIRDGDFYREKYMAIGLVLDKQFQLIYRNDYKVSLEEALRKVHLQDIFDLSYDQFLEFKEKEIRNALNNGADLRDLDTGKIP